MKRRFITEILAVTAVALGATATLSQSSKAQLAPGQRGFFCDTSTGIPTTVYQNSQGGREPWIKWESDAFLGAGYDPLKRCTEVSGRLETYRQNKQLKYITAGIMNRQQVICTASQVNGRCEGLIFTLKPNQDAVTTLNKLLAWREGQAGVPSLSESGNIPYIDVGERLENESYSVTTPQFNAQPVPPIRTPSNGSREL
ncbi:MAG: COP23 domain-containing protein [Lyngbya sp.]|nr:COP23 domain-containing protein [Lyngbya sp.]